MGRKPLYNREELSETLDATLIMAGEVGLRRSDLRVRLNIPDRVLHQVIHDDRHRLGGDGAFNIVTRKDGRQRYYVLHSRNDEVLVEWSMPLVRGLFTEIGTVLAVLSTIYRQVDGRTREGRDLRTTIRTLTWTQELLADLVGEAVEAG